MSIILLHHPIPQHMVHTTRIAYVVFAFYTQSSVLAAVKQLNTATPVTAFSISHHPRLIAATRNTHTMMATRACCPTKSTSNEVMLSTLSQQQMQEPITDEAIAQTSVNQPDVQEGTSVVSSTTATSNVPKNTFYRRSLPDTCVAFSSKMGRKYFESAMRNRGLKSYFHLMEQYTTQSEPAFCGISTLVIALNALAVDPRQIWKGSWRWYEESMLNCCIDLEQAKETGITMPMVNCLALCQGLSTEVHYADDKSSSVESFREMVKEACVESNDNSGENSTENSHNDTTVDRVLIVSYTRRALNQTGSGHFSPIAAYDQESDSVLIMDTARFKYGAHWVKLPLLYEAMQAVDPDTGRSRGYMMLIHPKDDDSVQSSQHRVHNLPIAILLRSEMKQSDVRRKFKNFLSGLGKKPSYDDIAHYFNKDGSFLSIWEMVLPQLRPYDNDIATMTIIDDVRFLTGLLLNNLRISNEVESELIDDSHHCRANHCRTIKLRTEEAILIVYLACLEVKEREALVFNPKFQATTTEQARFQLLAEAELVRYAIDTSDQLPTPTMHLSVA